MISAFTFKDLSLILVPALTIVLILALIAVLWPERTKDKTFILCQEIILTASLLSQSRRDKKTLIRIYKHLKNASGICGDLAGDEFYELSKVCTKITECFNIVAAIRLTKNLSNWDKYGQRIKNDISESINILKDFKLISEDMEKHEDELVKKTKQIFSQKYKINQAKNYLALIESEDNIKK